MNIYKYIYRLSLSLSLLSLSLSLSRPFFPLSFFSFFLLLLYLNDYEFLLYNIADLSLSIYLSI